MPAGDARLSHANNESSLPPERPGENLDLLTVSQDVPAPSSPNSLTGGRRPGNSWTRTANSFGDGGQADVFSSTSPTPAPPGYVAPGQRWPLDQWQPRPPVGPSSWPQTPPHRPEGGYPPRPAEPPDSGEWWPPAVDTSSKPEDPKPTKPPGSQSSWRPSANVLFENAARAGASYAGYRIFADRLPPVDTRVTPDVVRLLEPHAASLSASAGRVQRAIIPPYQDVAVDMNALWHCNPKLPDNYEKWFLMDKQGLLKKSESHALREWSQFRVTSRYLTALENSVETLQKSTDLRYLPVAGPAGPVYGRQNFNIPGWAPLHHDELRVAVSSFEDSRLGYNSEIAAVLKSRQGLIEAERRAAMNTLGGAFLVNAAMDYGLFHDNSPSLRTYVGDIVVPIAVMSTKRLNWAGRFGAIVGSHFVLKLCDRAEENEAKDKLER